MNTDATKNNETQSPKDYHDQLDYFWGEITEVYKDDKGERTGIVEIRALDGRMLQLNSMAPWLNPTRLAETVKAYSPIEPEVDDRGLFFLFASQESNQIDKPEVGARHVTFGYMVGTAIVKHIDKSGADIELQGDVSARMLATDWRWKPRQGQDVGKDLFCKVTQVDPHRKIVYLTKAKHMLRLVEVQRQFERGTVVQTAEPVMKDGKLVDVKHSKL